MSGIAGRHLSLENDGNKGFGKQRQGSQQRQGEKRDRTARTRVKVPDLLVIVFDPGESGKENLYDRLQL